MAAAWALLLGGCGLIDRGDDPPTLSSGAPDDTAAPLPDPDPETEADPDPVLEGFACRNLGVTADADVDRPELVETSGLAASRTNDGVVWAHNDSGQQAGIYALDLAGRDLGFQALVDAAGEPVRLRDVEDMAIVGDTIYMADIGDNGRRRDEVAVHVVDEPEPGGDGQVMARAVIRARYPDGPTDAEALLVDPVTGDLVILSKDLDDTGAPTRIYTLPAAEADGRDEAVELTLVGALDVAALTARSSVFSVNALLFPGSVTAADVSPDGGLIALRTYGSVWLFPRAAGQTLAEALGEAPCESGTASESQGEAIAFLPDEAGAEQGGTGVVRYVTISEGQNPPVHVATVEVAGRPG